MIDKKLMVKFTEIGKKEDFAALEALFSPEEVEQKGSIISLLGKEIFYGDE